MSPRNTEIKIHCSSVTTEDSGDYNELLLDNEQMVAHDLKLFSYTELKCATGKFENGKTRVAQHWAFKGWVDEKTYSPSKPGVGLAITMMQCLHRPEWDLQLWGEFSHPNLHRLLGYCMEDDKFYLVHEFMKNGNLEDYLRKEVAAELPFIMRVKIAVGVVRGLVFLHSKKLIIKGWMLNTHHISLDKDFNARLFYFDVARLVNKSLTIEFMSRQCDINGLGMLLLEILTGRPILTRRRMDLVIKEYPSNKVVDIPDTMIKDLVDPRMILSAPQIQRARELLSVILKCIGLYYTIDELLNDLEQIYSRMTRNGKIDINCHSVPAQDGDNHNDVPHGNGETQSSRDSKINIGCSSVPTEDGADHNDVPPGQGGTKALNNSKINIDCGSVPTEDRGDSSNVSPGQGETKLSSNSEINTACGIVSTEDSEDRNEVLYFKEKILSQDLKNFSYTDLICATGNFLGGTTFIGRHYAFKGLVHEKLYSPSVPGAGLAIAVMPFFGRPQVDLQLLGEFRHPNLQRILGYCLHNESFYLVHEFMENRNLEDYLRKGAATELTFIMRLKIAVGVARALVFLNHKQLIIKGWMLNTNHIWLDEDFSAKLVYFDVARLVSQSLKCRFLSRECDISGLGMLLLEILTGRPILTKRRMYMVIKEYLSSKFVDTTDVMIRNLADPRLMLNAPQTERARELLFLIQMCIGQRYSMEEAVEDLEQIYSRMT